ncbi:hypothetical protein GCM10009785_33960 [Brooklawnia cerclae]|uniref:Uncharacterized protein n=1 Tax=Brooklawnia cerclae TaxID=349934 RepID=A0ABX0SAK6_9ACTN|nr:hypothetical protein [Brooklawnia cerclae]NIH55437.1 hypothetical protein [Brooklawnia cerclae]
MASADETDSGSSLTVKWLNDDSTAASLQPERETTWLSEEKGLSRNPHYDDFKNLQVTVSQTEDLTDQTITIDVTGMPGGSVSGHSGMPGISSSTGYPSYVQNYLQVMQCWGDPTDDDFEETCQWGGLVLGSSSSQALVAQTVVYTDGGARDGSVPFRTVQDKEYWSNEYLAPDGASLLGNLLSPSTTNDVLAWPVKADGTTAVHFALQSSTSAPWLGCGADDDGSPRSCSIVIVPRGTIYGKSSSHYGASYGQAGAQWGGPLDTDADYWDNRIVIPLDFQSPTTACDAAGTTHTVGGSQLMIQAMQSWQRGICTDEGQGYSYSTASDSRARSNLLQGIYDFGLTSRAIKREELDETDYDAYDNAEVAYAPLAISGITIGFNIIGTKGVQNDIKLTPRLLAKLLTQSYTSAVPSYTSNFHYEHLSSKNPSTLLNDPEFKALNPDISVSPYPYGLADMIIMGPSGSDGIRLLWQYLQSDDKARAFLEGKTDNVLAGDEGNSGMTINPYYLPKGDPNAKVPETEEVVTTEGAQTVSTIQLVTDASGNTVYREVGLTDSDGNPLNLATGVIDTFPQADETEVPWRIVTAGGLATAVRSRTDTTAYNPYGETFSDVASRVAKADTKRATWDPTAMNSAQEAGVWKTSDSVQFPPRIGVLGTTDTASAEKNALATAQLQLPNQEGVFVSPTEGTMTAALSAQTAQDDTSGTIWADFSKLSSDSYPLTLVTYGALDLPEVSAEDRESYADLIEFAVTTGQASGTRPGQLPWGYAPLTDELVAQALAAAERIRNWLPSTGDGDTGSGGTTSDGDQSSSTGDGSAGTQATNPATSADDSTPSSNASQSTTEYSQAATTERGSTAAFIGAAALGAMLLVGSVGAAVAPLLLRRRSDK